MKASALVSVHYELPPGVGPAWPRPPAAFDSVVGHRTIQEGFELAELADELGFDYVSLSEHHYLEWIMDPAPFVLAGNLAQRLKRARIAILGPTLPLQNPVRVAEEIAFLDQISGGRIAVALLRGTGNELLAYRTNPAESREMYREAVELILKALTEPQPFGWQGRYYQYRTVSVWPRPLQQPHPPLFASASLDSLEFTAKHHLKGAVSFARLSTVVEQVARYNQVAREAGWEPTSDDFLYRSWAYVADTDEQAERDVNDYFGGMDMGLPPNVNDELTERRNTGSTNSRPRAQAPSGAPGLAFCGSPETVYRQIREFHEAGVGIVDACFQLRGMPFAKVRHSLELFGKEIVPRVHELSVPVAALA
jgi:alkanesulfonate monooxygenase SsuD/methylene tetrahydromethanopterin reductase-like flavin-dependent oxidoreductase (luciferase family)